MAFTFLTSVSAEGANGFTSGAINTTGANLIVMMLAGNDDNMADPTDSATNTWTGLTARGAGSSDIRLWYVHAPTTSAAHTFSVAGSNIFARMSVMSFSGAGASPFDQENGATAASGTSIATGSITPTQGNALVVAAAVVQTSQTGTTVDGGFTRQEHFTSAATSYAGAFAYLIQTTAAAANPTFTWQNTGLNHAVIASFKAGGGAASRRARRTTLGVG